MTNYTTQTKNLLQKQKAASFFNKADVGTNGGLGESWTRVRNPIHFVFYILILLINLINIRTINNT